MKKLILSLSLLLSALHSVADLTVFAAASTTDVMQELASEFKQSGGANVRFNFASSGALARQIDAGAPADLFISANVKWMDFLADQKMLKTESRADVVRNTLVLAAPIDSSMTYETFPGSLDGRLAVGDFKSVPAGSYAQAALKSLGWLSTVQKHLVMGTNVRTVLLYIERGETAAGIVYRTDAMRSTQVKVLGEFPATSHPAIVYPAACLKECPASADAFLAFIQSPKAARIWNKFGFKEITN